MTVNMFVYIERITVFRHESICWTYFSSLRLIMVEKIKIMTIMNYNKNINVFIRKALLFNTKRIFPQVYLFIVIVNFFLFFFYSYK